MKVGVALSGGKDSSLVAALLLREGHEVLGLHLLLCPEEYASIPSQEQLERVEDLARRLEIELRVVDARKRFSREVIAPFKEAYLRGKTPNPCVLCNRLFKFGLLLDVARRNGCDQLASGHYARREGDGPCLLKKNSDPERDESYFLFQLPRKTLPWIVFPLGERREAENLELGKKLLPGYTPLPISQEACFLTSWGLKRFLGRDSSSSDRPGPIVNRSGEKIGEHPGYRYYTVGQRKGLSSASGKQGPLFVLRVIPEENQVVVGDKEDLLSSRLVACFPNWVSIDAPSGPIQVQAKIRYNHPGGEALVKPLSEGRIEVEFSRPQQAVAPGQGVVFYRDDILLGGAWIEESR